MTLKGKKELSDQEREEIAQLMRLHHETHPARVALLYGITRRYVYYLWDEHVEFEFSFPDALRVLMGRVSRFSWRSPRGSLQATQAASLKRTRA
jgi:hypothetical protein